MEKATENLALILKYFGEFTPEQTQQLAMLEEAYKEWNSKINVISRKDIESLYPNHVLHSLSIAAVADFKPASNILDIGTGGGFPGIPLAIFFPGIQFHLVDSIGKKLKVVEAVAEAIGLKNVTTQHTRVEDIKNRKFDYVVSRAVAPLVALWTWSQPLLKTRSYKGIANPSISFDNTPLRSGLICLKGGDLRLEIEESRTKPVITHIHDLFPEEYFKEKFLVYLPA